MWSPKPKGKVIRRPKPSVLKPRYRAEAATEKAAEEQPQEKSDPHRDSRYFGFKHSDITRIFFVDSTNSVRRDCPTGPFLKKQTDITAHLENTIPSHASQTSPAPIPGHSVRLQASPGQPVGRQASPGQPVRLQDSPGQISRSQGSPGHTVTRSPGQASRVPGKRTEHGDARGRYPGHKRDQTSAGGGATGGRHQNENIRPTTAPTGEMRRLSAANAGHTPGPSTLRSGTAGSRRTPGSGLSVSRPGTRDSLQCSSSSRGSLLCSSSRGSLQCSSRLMSGSTSCGFGSRLQSVPE